MQAKFLLSFLLVFSANLWACPDFSGSWSCSSSEGTQKLVIEQNGHFLRITDEQGEVNEITADGVTRDEVITGHNEDGTPFQINVKETASCAGNTLNYLMQSVPSPEFPYNFSVQELWTKQNDRSTTATFTTNFMGQIETSQSQCSKL